jgi:exosortase
MGGLLNNTGDVLAIVLAGSRDFGRSFLKSNLPAPLWPVEGKPAIIRLFENLAEQGIKRAVICGGSDTSIYQKYIDACQNIEISFLDEPLPLGTAGCVRDASAGRTESTLLVLHGAIVSLPKIQLLLKMHSEANSDLTVFLNPPRKGCKQPELAGIYLCNRETLNCMPQQSYCDLKEGLIPCLWRADKKVCGLQLPAASGVYQNEQEYLNAIFECMQNRGIVNYHAHISPRARIVGPVTIMENAVIKDDAVILGPAVIEKNAVVESNAVVCQSVLWPEARIPKNCHISMAIEVADKSVFTKVTKLANAAVEGIKNYIAETQQLRSIAHWLWLILIIAACFWLYRPEISQLWEIWLSNDEYSSGLLVPFLAAYVIWNRRKQLEKIPKQSLLAGLAVFLFAQAVRFFGLIFMYDSAQRFSIVLSCAAIVIFLFGWQFFRKLSPILLFLCLMLPVPVSMRTSIMSPLQDWATSSAVFSLETMGFEVWREGNIIHIGNATVAVAEACNGLRMITAFFVISGFFVLLMKSVWWEKVIIFASALPIGLFCNTLRLTLTALAFTVLKGEFWEKAFHDFGGLLMMPMAIAVIFFELWLLRRLKLPPLYEAQMA